MKVPWRCKPPCWNSLDGSTALQMGTISQSLASLLAIIIGVLPSILPRAWRWHMGLFHPQKQALILILCWDSYKAMVISVTARQDTFELWCLSRRAVGVNVGWKIPEFGARGTRTYSIRPFLLLLLFMSWAAILIWCRAVNREGTCRREDFPRLMNRTFKVMGFLWIFLVGGRELRVMNLTAWSSRFCPLVNAALGTTESRTGL